MARISVSTDSGVLLGHYVTGVLCDIWKEQGHSIHVGRDFAADADLCILHHDRTRLDPADVPEAPKGVRVLNGSVLDISKRQYSELQVMPGDGWEGPVIVKSNLNSFGSPEVRASRSRLTRARRRLAGVSWKLARVLPKRTYPVLGSAAEVPRWVWGREDLLVERFMPEREGELYCQRGWLFFGTRGYGYKIYATDPMVKTGTMVKYDYLDEVPPEIEAHRASMGFDFGKFDYVVHDGRAILLDANKTATFAGDPRSERIMALAGGLEEVLR
ncbi:hypothetical protein FHY55_08895 [Oceanicola sp. D3]|uniref:hypothetical protein n=1 Tax=Oceanicola sp. D3 TaxID=2587163 RepID=UPI00112232EB|nr:hypothetical protein [Oceanicola sp. D3]QDC09353.1 hypothetical protein FHY55_08895 [Oceanicola sp. D3]